MIKDNYPMRITRDDTEHGVFYYSEKDVMKMLEIARIEEREQTNQKANASWARMCEKMVAAEREACAKLAETASDYLQNSTFQGVANAIRARAKND
jgi:flagellar biosynthesis/type III secretory pathway protein FliH